MTKDEEKSEEYVKKQILKHNRDVVLRPKNAVTYIDELKQAYLDGLAEGRKESEKLLDKLNLQNQRLNELKNENDYLRNDFIYIIQDKTKRALLKENAELKAQIDQLSNDNHVLKTSFITQQEQIGNLEEDKGQIIFESDLKIKALEEMIEKMKCCQMCKYLEDNGSCLRADKDEVNKWGDFLIGTRRKNHCKYWELEE